MIANPNDRLSAWLPRVLAGVAQEREKTSSKLTIPRRGLRRSGLIGLGSVSVLASAIAAFGCSGSSSSNGGTSGNGADSGGSGATGNGGSSGIGGGGQSGGTASCTNVTPCGGGVVATWNVTSSCLTLSGSMDVFSVGMGCPTVPVSGSLHVNGLWTANADGTYTDNTTTTGSITFPLDSSCMTISSVPVTCSKAQGIFSALGWASATCTDKAGGGCNCTAIANQSGGIGSISGNASPTGGYAISGNTLTSDNTAPLDPNSTTVLKYSYCVSGNTLTLSPQSSSVLPIAGTVTLQKNGTTAGTGGAPGTGGAGAGGNGAGGAPTATGGNAAGGQPGNTGGRASTGGAFTGGVVGAGGAPTGGKTGAGGASTSTGGVSPTGGMSATAGTSAKGGTSAAGGLSSTATGGATTTGTSTGPCDIYAAASNKCVAAHSTVRALFGSYSGPLYQVKRASDSTTKDIGVPATGGFADTSAQDTFCTGTTCTITKVYDQSGNGNFVEAETTDFRRCHSSQPLHGPNSRERDQGVS